MKNRNIPLVVGFCTLLLAMSLSFFVLPQKDFSENEKRVLQSIPKLNWSRLADGRFFSSLDSYISDHFAGRNFWVGLNAYHRQAIGLNAASEIYRGKNGWLMERPIDFEANRRILQNNSQTIADFAQSTDIPVSLLCVPTTGYIMKSQLPALHDAYPDDEMMQNIQAICGETVQWIDVQDTLRNTAHGNTFYRTDHHWTSRGAYQAYQTLARAWGLIPANETEYEVASIPGFYGTTYSKSGLWATKADQIELWNDCSTQSRVSIYDENKPFPLEHESVFFETHLDAADKYPVFLDGNHGLVKIKSNAPSGKLLIIRDSFAHCLAPFLTRHFQEIDLIDLRYFKNQTVSDYMKEQKYDRILLVYGLSSLAEDRSLQWLA
jgi:hypothetical protein